MIPSFLLLFALFLFVPNATAQESDIVIDHLAMKLTNRLLKAFDTRNYTGFTDFDVKFTFDDCRIDRNQTEFMKAVAEFRNSFSSGTVIKYGFMSAMRIFKQYDGIQFSIHFEYLGQHHDLLVNFLRIRLSTGSLWKWVHAWKINCSSEHERVYTDNDTFQKVLS